MAFQAFLTNGVQWVDPSSPVRGMVGDSSLRFAAGKLSLRGACTYLAKAPGLKEAEPGTIPRSLDPQEQSSFF